MKKLFSLRVAAPLFCLVLCLAFVSCRKEIQLSDASIEMQKEFGAEGADDFCYFGICYFYGWDGFPVDYKKALELFKDAAKMQSGEACAWIGEFYAGGYVYKQNYKKAALWFEKAAALGYMEAFFKLGVLYENGGHGLKADSKKSNYWYEKAEEAQAREAALYKAKSPFELLSESAEMGNADSQCNLGRSYFFESEAQKHNIEPDVQKALYWLEKAAGQNHEESLFLLGQIYGQNIWVKRDPEKSAAFYQRAVNLGHAGAAFNLGEIYEAGNGVQEDPAKALDLYKKAALGGHAKAAYYVAIDYLIPDFAMKFGVQVDKEEARKWLLLSANNGEPLAQKKLAELDGE